MSGVDRAPRAPFRLLPILVLLLALPAWGADADEKLKSIQDWTRTLDKEAVHRAVLAHERDPLGERSVKVLRPDLSARFEKVPEFLCLDPIASLLETKQDLARAVYFQVIFGGGDFLASHPAEAADTSAATLAGLESGLRAYEQGLRKQPKARVELLDTLLAMRGSGRLEEFLEEHRCAGEGEGEEEESE